MLENFIIFALLIFGAGGLLIVHNKTQKKRAKRKQAASATRHNDESMASQNVAMTMAMQDDYTDRAREEDLEVLDYLRDENPSDDIKPEITYEEPVEHRISTPTPAPAPAPAPEPTPVERSEPSGGYSGDSSGGGDTGGGGGGE